MGLPETAGGSGWWRWSAGAALGAADEGGLKQEGKGEEWRSDIMNQLEKREDCNDNI